MKLAVNLEHITSLEAHLIMQKKYAVNYIEVRPQTVNGNKGTFIGCDTVKVKDLLNQYDVKAAAVSLADFKNRLSPKAEEYSVALLDSVEFAHAIGAKFVNHYICLTELPLVFSVSELMRYIGPALKKAEELGVTLVLENESIDATRTPERLLEILLEVDSNYYKTNYDASNFYAGSVEGYPWAYDILKEHIVYAHIKDACLYNPAVGHTVSSKGFEMIGYNEDKFIYFPMIPHGSVNNVGILHRLKQDGYKGFCTMEPHTTIEYLEDYLRQESAFLQGLNLFDEV